VHDAPRRRPASSLTTLIYVVLATAAIVLALLPVSGAIQRRFLANHHVRPSSTASWIVVGLLPKMYGGRHEVWLSPEQLTEFMREDPQRAAQVERIHQWVNHSPGRFIRLDTARGAVAEYGAPTFVRLESSYRNESMTTVYQLRAVGGARIEVRLAP
jgi:hypothetical protein